METTQNNLQVGKHYTVTTESGITFNVILRSIGNPNHKRPLNMVADAKRTDFIYGLYANEVKWEEAK